MVWTYHCVCCFSLYEDGEWRLVCDLPFGGRRARLCITKLITSAVVWSRGGGALK